MVGIKLYIITLNNRLLYILSLYTNSAHQRVVELVNIKKMPTSGLGSKAHGSNFYRDQHKFESAFCHHTSDRKGIYFQKKKNCKV